MNTIKSVKILKPKVNKYLASEKSHAAFDYYDVRNMIKKANIKYKKTNKKPKDLFFIAWITVHIKPQYGSIHDASLRCEGLTRISAINRTKKLIKVELKSYGLNTTEIKSVLKIGKLNMKRSCDIEAFYD